MNGPHGGTQLWHIAFFPLAPSTRAKGVISGPWLSRVHPPTPMTFTKRAAPPTHTR